MRRLRLLILVSLLGVPKLFAEGSPPFQVVGPFSGLNNADNSAVIPEANAQDLLNVDLSLGGKSVIKRKGYGTAFSTTFTTSPIHGVYDFYDASGNDISLAFNDTYLTAVVNGGTASVLFSTGTNGATYQCVDSQGYAYCANSNRTNIIQTNGSVVARIIPISTGSIVALTPDRLVLGGFAEAPNRVDFSAGADFNTWTTGVSATSAFNFTITAPGSKITHLTYAFNRIMWFKDSSFGYILPGATAADWVVKTVSPNVGTLDNSSIYWQGILYFRGQDSHIYSYDGSNLQKMTRIINGTIATSQTRRNNSYTQTTSADFGSGNFNPSVYADTITTSGQIQLTYPDGFSTYRDGTSGTKAVYSTFTTLSAAGSAAASSGKLAITNNGGTTGEIVVKTVNALSNYQVGTTYHILISSIPADITNPNNRLTIAFSSRSTTNITGVSGLSSYWNFVFISTETGRASFSVSNSSGDSINQASYTVIPCYLDFYISTTNYSYAINGTTLKSGTHTWARNPLWAYFAYFRATSGAGVAQLDDFSVIPESTTYLSPVDYAPNLTVWDSLTVTASTNGATETFYMRADTNSFTINSATPSWTAVTNGTIPSLSTGTYFQFRADIVNVSSADTPVFYDFTIRWLEGSATDKAYATYFKDALWFSVTAGDGGTTNNTILRYDLINNAWLKYDLPANGFYVRNNSLYFGGSTVGKVFKFGDVDNDNGSAINAYWKSKDFFNTSPFTDDDITDVSVFFSAVNASTISVTYTLVGGSSTTYTIPTTRSNAAFGIFNRNMPLGTVGNTMSIQFGNNSADQPFEVFAAQYGLKPKPWRPGQ